MPRHQKRCPLILAHRIGRHPGTEYKLKAGPRRAGPIPETGTDHSTRFDRQARSRHHCREEKSDGSSAGQSEYIPRQTGQGRPHRQTSSPDPQKTDGRLDTQRDPRQTLGIRDRSNPRLRTPKTLSMSKKDALSIRRRARRRGLIDLGRREPHREIVVDKNYHQNKANSFRCRTVRPTHMVYRDRPYVIPHRDRYVHMFYDTYDTPVTKWSGRPSVRRLVSHGGDWAWTSCIRSIIANMSSSVSTLVADRLYAAPILLVWIPSL